MSPSTSAPRVNVTSWPARERIAAMYARWTLGTSWNFFLRYAITFVTRENGSSRDPYPPTTVSLLTNPRVLSKSASTTRISHLKSENRNDHVNNVRPGTVVREANGGKTLVFEAAG